MNVSRLESSAIQQYRATHPDKQLIRWDDLLAWVNENAPWGNGEGLIPPVLEGRNGVSKKVVAFTDEQGKVGQTAIKYGTVALLIGSLATVLPLGYLTIAMYYDVSTLCDMAKFSELRYQISQIFKEKNIAATYMAPDDMVLNSLDPSRFTSPATFALLHESSSGPRKVMILAMRLKNTKGEQTLVVWQENPRVNFKVKKFPVWTGYAAYDSQNRKQGFPTFSLSKFVSLPASSSSLRALEQILAGTHKKYSLA